MRQHMVPASRFSFVSERRNINRRNNDPFARPWTGLSQKPSIEIHYLTAPRPRIRWIMFQAGSLICSNDECGILHGAATVHNRPPVHGLSGTPWIHVGRNADKNLSAIRSQLSDCLRKQPVITDGAANASDWSIGNGKQRFVVSFKIVRTRMDLERYACIHLPVRIENSLRADQTSCVENNPGPFRIDLE